jgi:transposase
MPDATPAGYTTADIAKRFRVGEDKIRSWIRSGELIAINTADVKCGKPRFVVTAESLAAFERGRQTVTPPKPARRKKRTNVVDFYPD